MFSLKTIDLKVIFVLVLVMFVFSLGGCSRRMAFGGCIYRVKTGECHQAVAQDANITATSYAAADHLIRNATHLLYPDFRLLVTSIADIDNLEDSTSFGRLVGEQLSARFAQQGYTVIEAKLHSDLFVIPRTGEFVLSRDVRETALKHHANMVVAGTYAVGQDKVYITLKMLNCKTTEIMSSHAYNLPLGPNTYSLLQKRWWW